MFGFGNDKKKSSFWSLDDTSKSFTYNWTGSKNDYKDGWSVFKIKKAREEKRKKEESNLLDILFFWHKL